MMGYVSLEQLRPDIFSEPDSAGPISRLGLPQTARVMRAGFVRGVGGTPVFEGETEVKVRLIVREWRYRQLPDVSVMRKARRWRFELGLHMDKAAPLAPGHVAVVAQEPYGNSWVQPAPFRKYSKKSKKECEPPVVPESTGDLDPVGWLETHLTHDPWESDRRMVAGISDPHGFASDHTRNTGGDLVLGACPDFMGLVEELFASREIKHLIHQTEYGRIAYWNARALNTPAPPLDPEVVADCHSLMWTSIRQALAGPRRAADSWIGRPVWKWASLVYRDHLNERNRAAYRGRGRSTRESVHRA